MFSSYHFVCEQLSATTSLSSLRVSLLPRETEVTSGASGSVALPSLCGGGLCELFIFTAKMPELAVENVVVHPLVLLSVVDHFNRSVSSVFVFSLYESWRLKCPEA